MAVKVLWVIKGIHGKVFFARIIEVDRETASANVRYLKKWRQLFNLSAQNYWKPLSNMIKIECSVINEHSIHVSLEVQKSAKTTLMTVK